MASQPASKENTRDTSRAIAHGVSGQSAPLQKKVAQQAARIQPPVSPIQPAPLSSTGNVIQCQIGDEGNYCPVYDNGNGRYIAIREATGGGAVTYRLINLLTGAVTMNISSTNPAFHKAFSRRLRGFVTAEDEDTRTVTYAPGHTVNIDLMSLALELLHVGDEVTFELDEEGEVDTADIVPQQITFTPDEEGLESDDTGNRVVVPIGVQQQNGPVCWAAVSASIAAYWDEDTEWTQELLITTLGNIADTHESVSTALGHAGISFETREGPLTYQETFTLISEGKPIIAGLAGQPGHVVIICGAENGAAPKLCIADPNHGGNHYWVNYRHFAMTSVQYPGLLPSLPFSNMHWGFTWITTGGGGGISEEDVNINEDDITQILNNAHVDEVLENMDESDIPSLLHHRDNDVADDLLDAFLGEDVMHLIHKETGSDSESDTDIS